MRRAEWRRFADEPQGLRLLGTAVRDAFAIRTVREFVGGVLGIVLFVGLFSLLFIGPAAFFLGIVVLGLLCLIASFLAAPVARLHGKPDDVRPELLPDDAYLVHLAVRYKGALTGLDDALAVFVDGWLYLEGKRATLSLHAADGKSQWRDGVLRVAFEDGQSVEVWYADGPVGSLPYFAHAATLWVAERDHPGGEPIRPPLEAHPVVLTGWKTVLLLATLSALPLVLLTPRFALAALALILDLALAVWAILCLARQSESDRRARALPEPSAGFGPPLDSGLQSGTRRPLAGSEP